MWSCIAGTLERNLSDLVIPAVEVYDTTLVGCDVLVVLSGTLGNDLGLVFRRGSDVFNLVCNLEGNLNSLAVGLLAINEEHNIHELR